MNTWLLVCGSTNKMEAATCKCVCCWIKLFVKNIRLDQLSLSFIRQFGWLFRTTLHASVVHSADSKLAEWRLQLFGCLTRFSRPGNAADRLRWPASATSWIATEEQPIRRRLSGPVILLFRRVQCSCLVLTSELHSLTLIHLKTEKFNEWLFTVNWRYGRRWSGGDRGMASRTSFASFALGAFCGIFRTAGERGETDRGQGARWSRKNSTIKKERENQISQHVWRQNIWMFQMEEKSVWIDYILSVVNWIKEHEERKSVARKLIKSKLGC